MSFRCGLVGFRVWLCVTVWYRQEGWCWIELSVYQGSTSNGKKFFWLSLSVKGVFNRVDRRNPT